MQAGSDLEQPESTEVLLLYEWKLDYVRSSVLGNVMVLLKNK